MPVIDSHHDIPGKEFGVELCQKGMVRPKVFN